MKYIIKAGDQSEVTLTVNEGDITILNLNHKTWSIGEVDLQKNMLRGFYGGVTSAIILIVIGLALSDLIK